MRNGERWTVSGTARDGAVLVHSLDGRGNAILPQHYVEEHVGLAYALTVHKAQGQTVDHGVLVVDPHMTRNQLYVGMTRGRSSNKALLVAEVEDHDHRRPTDAPTPIKTLAKVMQSRGNQSSAHQVMREEFDASEEIVRRIRERRMHDELLRSEPWRNLEVHPVTPAQHHEISRGIER